MATGIEQQAANPYDAFDDVGVEQGAQKNPYDSFDTPQRAVEPTNVPSWGEKYPNLYGVAGATYGVSKPLLEATGLAGGAIIGLGVANPVGGAGGGYAIAKQIEQLAGEFLGVRESLKQSERFKQLRNDVILGEMIEMGGGIANKFIFEPLIRGGKWVFNFVRSSFPGGKPGPAVMKQASKVWEANTSTGPIYAKNRQEAEQLEEMIPGLKFTEGQRAHDPKRIQFERVAFRKPGNAGVLSVEQQAANDIALKSYYQKNFGTDEGIDDFYRALNSKYSSMQNKAEAIKSMGARLESTLEGGNIQLMHKNLIERIKYNRKIVHDDAEKLYKLLPQNVELETSGMLAEFKEIGKKTSKVENPANIPDVLKRVKSRYIKSPPKELVAMIDSFTSQGKPLPKQLLELQAKYKDVGKLPFKEVKGIRTEILNEQRRVTSKTGERNPALEKRLAEMLDATERTLEQLGNSSKYGENVSEIYSSASAKWRHFRETYDSGTIGELLQKGPKGEPFRLTPEQSLARIFNRNDLRAADQLNKAIGKESATKMVREYADYALVDAAKDPLTLEINHKKLVNWLNNHSSILKKYGLGDTYKNLELVKSAAIKANDGIALFEKSQAMKMLGVDVDKAVQQVFTGKGGTASAKTARELLKVAEGNPAAQKGIRRAFTDNILKEIEVTAKEITGTPTVSVAKFNKVYEKYLPALKEFYKGEPKKIQSLKNMKRAYEIMIRNKTSPIGGGSDTFQNTVTALYQAIGNAPVGGPIWLRAIRSAGRIVTSFKQKQVEQVLTRAIFDPDVAFTLEMMARGQKFEVIQHRFEKHIASLTMLAYKQVRDKEK